MGTATEQSLRDILAELETHTLADDAATETTLAACLVALQLVDDLRNALASVATDDIRVAPGTNPLTVQAQGGDKLFSFESTIRDYTGTASLASGTNTIIHTVVPTGKVWIVTNICQWYIGTAPTAQYIRVYDGSLHHRLAGRAGAVDPNVFTWTGWIVIPAGSTVRHVVEGATAGDDLYGDLFAVQLDAPS